MKFYILDKLNKKTEALSCIIFVLRGISNKEVASVALRYEVSWKAEWNPLCVPNDTDFAYYRSLAENLLKIYGGNHPEVANNYRREGLVWRNLGHLEKARHCFKNAVDVLNSLKDFDKNSTNYENLLKEETALEQLLKTERRQADNPTASIIPAGIISGEVININTVNISVVNTENYHNYNVVASVPTAPAVPQDISTTGFTTLYISHGLLKPSATTSPPVVEPPISSSPIKTSSSTSSV
jgi:tetratricopeptide (TPR) repeat protein